MARIPTKSISTVVAVLSALVIAGVAGGYTVYWFRLAEELRTGVERWAAEWRAGGDVVAYGDLRITGFPGQLRIQAAAPVIGRVSAAPRWRWAGPALSARLAPWDLRRATIRLDGAHRLDMGLDGRPRRVRAAAATALVEVLIGPDGRVRAAALKASAVTARLAPTGKAVSAAGLEIVIRPRPPAAAGQGYDLALAVEKLVLPTRPDNPLGPEIGRLVGEAGVAGPLPLDGSAAAAQAWRDAGGRLDIRFLRLRWGALQLEASGKVGLDAKLQPRAELDGRLRGWNEILGALVAEGRMQWLQATAAGLALTALARPAEDGGPPVLPAKISLRDRRLYLGPVRIHKLRRLDWRQSPGGPPGSRPRDPGRRPGSP